MWAIPHLKEESDSVWRAVLLAAGAEADAASPTRGRGRRTDLGSAESDRHVETLEAVGADLYAPGPLGTAWTKHLAAELSRYRRADGPDMWRDVHDAWDTIGVQHDRGWALLRLAECQLTNNDRNTAQTAIIAAQGIATGLGARPLERKLLEVAVRARLRVELPGAVRDGATYRSLSSLTPREIDVLKLVARGHSNDQIADLLFISPKTVSVHVSRILAKLHVRSRTEATALAFRNGMVED